MQSGWRLQIRYGEAFLPFWIEQNLFAVFPPFFGEIARARFYRTKFGSRLIMHGDNVDLAPSGLFH